MVSRKYGRTLHYPFSPGTTNDDRVNTSYWTDLSAINNIIHTEKLDGENNCIAQTGVYARSHAATATTPWTEHLRRKWAQIRHDLGDYELFGENLYGIHSIAYQKLDAHFYVFAVREHDKWLSWEETCFIASVFDMPVVPVITIDRPAAPAQFQKLLIDAAGNRSTFDSYDVVTGNECSMEGIVTRNAGEYGVEAFAGNVFKYVRAGHVKTNEHWTRNWKRAPLKNELL